MLVMEDVDCGYRIESATDHSFTEKCIVSDVKFSLQIGQRIGLLGVNGAGKSTLIKTIVGDIPPLHGTMQTGKGLSIGYFAQHQVEMLRHDESPLWHLAHIAPDVREQELRNFLGGFNFPGTMVTSPIKPFSGGEKARLALAMIVWQRPNLLLLDEPTNHLDLETREALTDALAQFEGTLVVVSHDRHLLRATTDEFIIVADGKLQPFDGDLDDYKDWLFKNKLEKAATPAALPQKEKKEASLPLAKSIPVAKVDDKEQRKRDAEERQRLANVRKPIEARIKRLEDEMAKLNSKKKDIDVQLEDSDIYSDANKEKLKTLLLDQAYLVKELSQIEADWLEQQEFLEAAV
jgi:ATP-binding cassette subfamily F protein 3